MDQVLEVANPLGSASSPRQTRDPASSPRRRPSRTPTQGEKHDSALQPAQHQVAILSPPLGQFFINTLLQIAGFAAAIAFGVYAVKSVTVGSDANRYAAQAIEQSVTANQLALLAVCLTNQDSDTNVVSICARVINGAASVLPQAASVLFTNLPTVTSTRSSLSAPPSSSTASPTASNSLAATTSTSTSRAATSSTSTQPQNPDATSNPTGSPSSAGGRKLGAIIGIAVGVTVGVIILLAIAILFWRRRRERRASRFQSAPTAGDGPSSNELHLHSPLNVVSPRNERITLAQVLRGLFVDSMVTTQAEEKRSL